VRTFVQQLINGVALGSVYGFIAVGYSLTFGVLRVFNIAHGDIAIASAYVGLAVAEHGHANIWLVAVVVLLAGFVLGAVVERVCIRPVARGPWTAALLTTLGASMVIAGVIRSRFGADVRPLPLKVGQGTMSLFGIDVGKTYVFVLVTALVLTVAMELVLRRTVIGRWLRAISEDPENAELVGIPVPLVRLGTVMVSSALGAGAGLLLGVLLSGLTPGMGFTLAIKGLIVLIVGGLNSPRGAMVLGVFLGAAEVLTSAYVSSSLRDLVAYLLLLGILVVRPTGLFGRANELLGARP
jgi:branched-chain amino acid transport system permease protein